MIAMYRKITQMRKWLVMLLCMTGSVISARQDDLGRLIRESSGRRLSYTATYRLYDAHEGGRLLESQHMEVKMWDAMMQVRTALFHMVRNKEHYLYVDLSRKVMLVNKVSSYKDDMKEAELLGSLLSIDSLVKNSNARLISTHGDECTYRMDQSGSSRFSHTELTFNRKTLALKKNVIYLKSSLSELLGKDNEHASSRRPRIEMSFTAFEYLKQPGTGSFSINPYVSRKNGRLKPLPAYSAYQFIDYTQLK